MNKNQTPLLLLALAVVSGPVWADAGPHAVAQAEARELFQPAQVMPPAESAISLMPSALTSQPPQAVAHLPGEASISVLPSRVAQAPAARADVQAMVNPEVPIAPAAGEISNMSGDAASGAGEAIMDRILYIKGTPASGSAVPIAGSQGAPAATLRPARHSALYYLLVGPAKIATKSTEYLSQKTRIPPFWTALGMSFLNVAGTLKTMTDKHWDLPMSGVHMTGTEIGFFVGFTLMALMYLGHASWWMKDDAEKAALKKMDAAVSKGQESVKGVPGVLSVTGETIPGKNANDHVIIVKVSHLDTANINKIPKAVDGFNVRVQFVR